MDRFPRASNEVADEATQNHKAWRSVVAKVGHPKAAEIRPGGTLQQCHESRKTVRQAINAMTLDQSNREPSEEEVRAMHHAGSLVASLNTFIDRLEEMQDGKSRTRQSVMRNSQDYHRHYNRHGDADGEGAIGIDDFFRGVANLPTTSSVKNALSVGTTTSGGYAVPSVLMPTILDALAPNSALIQAGMGVIDISEIDALSYSTAAIDTIPTAAWRAENGAVAESDPAFRRVLATPRSLSFFFKVSRELLADAPDIQRALLTAISQAFAKALDRTGLRGSGTAPEPQGLLGLAGVHSVTNGTNGTLLTSYANVFSALQSILQADAPMPTAAIMSPRSLVKMGGLVDTSGQPLARPTLLENLALLYTSQVPNNLTVGSSTDCSEIFVGDFTQMNLLLREAVSVQLLSERYAEAGQIGFMCHVRADFAVNYPAAFAVVTGVR
jgi:HK97 family phage major capsid protein